MNSRNRTSELQKNPKSRVLKPGYINTYSNLDDREKRQIEYKTKYKEQNEAWDETQVYLSKKYKELVPNNAVVLDAGCGHGNYVIDENRKTISWAVGVDLSEEFTNKNVCLDQVVHADLEQLPFKDGEFDVVLSLWVLEHIENPDKVFGELHRVLKPGGLFMFCAPNKFFLPLLAMQVLKNSGLNHLLNKYLFGRKEKDIFEAYYNANSLGELTTIAKSGFEVVELRYNYDPGYTSFNDLTFKLSGILHRVLAVLGITLTYPHIIGILRKK